MQYGASVSRELPGAINLTDGLHRKPRQGHVPARRGEHARLQHPRAPAAELRADRLQDVGLRGWPGHQRHSRSTGAAVPHTTRCSSAPRDDSAPGFTGGVQYQYSRNKGTTQGSNEAATSQNTFDYETEYGTNPQDIPHTFNGSIVYLVPGEGLWRGGWRVGGILNARSGVPINVTDQPRGQRDGRRADGHQHSWRQQPRHAAARPGSWRRPISEGWRALAQSGGIYNAAARHVRQPGRAMRCAGPGSCSST